MENNLARNEVKQRFDGKGSEFGWVHRDLGQGLYMFDIDRIEANVNMDLTLRRENELFTEYVHITSDEVKFLALYEIKNRETSNSLKCLDAHNSLSVARLEMARRLGARLFIVYATNGQQPFKFYEINTGNGSHVLKGVLSYQRNNDNDREQKTKRFWYEILKIRN